VFVLEFVVGLAVLSMYSNALLVFAIALLTCVALIVFGLGRRGIATSIDESYAKYDVAGWLEELVRHPTAFRGGAARALGVDRAEALARAYVGSRTGHFKILLRQSIGGFALQAVASAVLLGVGGALVIAGSITLGQLVAAELIVGAIVAALSKLAKQLEVAYDLFAAVDKIGHLVDLDVERVDGAAVHAAGGLGVSAVHVEATVGDRAFTFGSFSLPAGAQVALVGDSGAGKSLLVDVLLGWRDLSAGRLAINGDDLRDLSLESLRSRVGLCRDVEIFGGSVAENLRVGRHALRTRDLVEALRVVELDEALLSRRAGLSSLLVHGSGLLSEGQGRRLMLARALLGDPGLVLIDGSLDGFELPLLLRLVPRVKQRLSDLGATLVVTTCRPEVAALFDRALTLTTAGVVDTAEAT
jgi:ABC-type bacteriocin/lantibiotic exporter with double-glycine peptidase domain